MREQALHELGRLEKMPPMAAEAVVVRTYLDWLVSLPWSKETRDRLDISVAEQILEEDHYGLERVKERILEFLAVRQLTKKMKGPILLLGGTGGWENISGSFNSQGPKPQICALFPGRRSR